MVFWTAMLLGAAFAWMGIKLKFYETWALFFNILISIYTAVFLAPIIAGIPYLSDKVYGVIAAFGGVGIIVFGILHGISYTLITGQFSVPYPKAFDVGASAVLGFLAGMLVTGFLIVALCVTPLAEKSLGKTLNLCSGSSQPDTSSMNWWCDRVNSLVGSAASSRTAEDAINDMLKNIDARLEQKNRPAPPPPPPPPPVEVPKEDPLGPPPEANIQDY